MKLIRFVLIATTVSCSYALDFQVTLPAVADIFAAGHGYLPGTTNPGIFPTSLSFLPAFGETLIFPSVSGSLACDISASSGADGSCGSTDTSIDNIGGLSGIFVAGSNMFLAGVFLDSQEPSGLGPDALQYNTGALGSLNTTDAVFSPTLAQVFFIGDGRAGDNSIQRFTVPNGATRLLLGFAGTSSGLPSFDAHNGGALVATFDIGALPGNLTASDTPEPPSYSLILGGLLVGLTLLSRKYLVSNPAARFEQT